MALSEQKLLFGLPILLAALGVCGVFVVYAQSRDWPLQRIQRVGLRVVMGVLLAGVAMAFALAWLTKR